ncbi:hypothetical protein VRB50_11110 [Pseudomonas poae]|uniref:hypothetical protein n=1 Tax=Pseudomonas poae TaxID=200451 RepID=UPI0030D18EB4
MKEPVHLSRNASYYPDKTGTWNQVSLLQLLKDHGWDIPNNHEQLENLATALATPALTSPAQGNLGGALAWPAPLSKTDSVNSSKSYTRPDSALRKCLPMKLSSLTCWVANPFPRQNCAIQDG